LGKLKIDYRQLNNNPVDWNQNYEFARDKASTMAREDLISVTGSCNENGAVIFIFS